MPNRPSIDVKNAMISGLAGAAAVTVIHETARHLLPHPPRVDAIGSRAIVAMFHAAGRPKPRPWPLYGLAILADVLSNGAIYATIPLGPRRTLYPRGLVIGLLTGVSALVLPPLLKLGRQPGQRTPMTQLLTLLWYGIGGLVAADTSSKL